MENLLFTPAVFANQATPEISQDLLCSVANFEGFREKPYICPSGVLTVGFGHTSGVTADTVFSIYYAKLQLRDDLLVVYNIIKRVFPLFDCLPMCYYNMLLDLAFNCGTSYFSDSNTSLHKCVSSLCKFFNCNSNVSSDFSDTVLCTVLRYCHSNGRVSLGLLRRRYLYAKQCILWHEKNGYLK